VRNLGAQGGCERSAAKDLVIQPTAAPVLVNPGDQIDARELRSYSQTVLSDGAIGYWRLDEEDGVVVDWASTNAGSRIGGVTRIQPGALADVTAAAALDGTTGYVRIPNSPSLQVAGDLTIELWANLSLTSRQTLISKHYAREFELTLETSGSLNLYQGNGSAIGNVWSAPGVVTPNVWQHIVVTRSTSTKTVRFYVNGRPKGVAVYSVDPSAGTGPITIGRSASGSQYVNGRLDEIALFPLPLSDAQVLKHYAMRLVAGGVDSVDLPLVASDANGDTLTYAADGLPPGLAINAATGLISGSLLGTSPGVYPVLATVSDGLLSHSQSFVWTVTQPNRAPVLTSPDAQLHAEGASISMQVLASDPDNDSLTFSAIGLPPPLAIDPVTGIISGVLSFQSSGAYPVIVAVTDGVLSTSSTFAWIVTNINRAPVLVNPGAQTHYARGEYSLAVMRDRPAAYWRLGETNGLSAAENSGRYPGTLAGNVAPGRPGALADGDRAMLFDGASGYVQAAGVPGLAGDLTIELWVKISIGSRQTLI
jgi:hypothetical protein